MNRKSLIVASSLAGRLSFSGIAVCLAYSQLIYTGPLEEMLPYGILCTLLSAGILALIIAVFSSIPTAFSRPKNEPLPLVILMVHSMALYFSTGHGAFLTILISISLTTFITGLLLFGFGIFRLGNFARFAPFPVIAGFLASAGLLLLLSSIRQAIPTHHFTLEMVHHLFDPTAWLLWVPSLCFGLGLFVIFERYSHPLFFSGSIIGGIILFYIILFASGQSVAWAQQNHLLLHITPISWHSFVATITFTESIDWYLIFAQLGNMLMIAFVSLLALLFINLSLELIIKKEIDFNKELRVTGLANIFAALTGGLIGYHEELGTSLCEKFNIHTRTIGIISGLSCLATLFFIQDIINYLPRFILIGLVFLAGLSLFYKWTFRLRDRLDLWDSFIICAVVLAVMFFGFVKGAIAGFFISVLFFMLTYSRINNLRFVMDGKELTSSKGRDPEAQAILKKNGDKILYLKLQDYLFFGSTAVSVLQLKNLLSEQHDEPAKYVLYDFERVCGIDSSVQVSFQKISQFAAEQKLYVILTGFTENNYPELAKKMTWLQFHDFFRYIPDADAALDFCEVAVLKENHYAVEAAATQRINLEDFLGDKSLASSIPKYFDDVHLNKGDMLVYQGHLSQELYYLEAGYLTVFINVGKTRTKKLFTIGPGNIVGELAFYLNSSRSASIIAEEASSLKRLIKRDLTSMELNDPLLATAFNQAIICLLSTKLVDTTKKVEILSN